MILIEFIGVAGDNLWNTQIFPRPLKPLSRFSVFVTLLWKGVRQGDRFQPAEHFFSVHAKYWNCLHERGSLFSERSAATA